MTIGSDNVHVDLQTFAEIFVLREYAPLDVRSAHVLDLGAHKGYFAAWALRRGAAFVFKLRTAPQELRRLADNLPS